MGFLKGVCRVVCCLGPLLGAGVDSASASVTLPAAAGRDGPRVQSVLEQALAAEAGGDGAADPARAARLYCDAARSGSSEAHYRLGKMYLSGRGVPRDLAVASTLLGVAGQRGHVGAQDMVELTGRRDKKLPLCMTHPASTWMSHMSHGIVDVERYAATLGKDRRKVADLVRKLAPTYSVHPRLALAIATVESNFDSAARSPKNAMGVMQLIPETAERFGVKDAFDAEQNVRGGLAYLRWLLKRFNGDLALVSAAYNAGEGAVDRYEGVPPYAETQVYVQRVIQFVGPRALLDTGGTGPTQRAGVRLYR